MALNKSTRLDRLLLDVRRGYVEIDFSVVVDEDGTEIAARSGSRGYENTSESLTRLDADVPAALALRIKQIMGWT